MAVAFYMLPFLVNKLSDKWYGIWTILGGLVGYYYLVDFGLATAVSRYVTKYITKEEPDSTNVIINTSVVIYCFMGLLIIGVTIILCVLADYIVSDHDALKTVRIVLMIMGINLALEFPFKAFAGIIGAYVRYELLSLSHVISLVISTSLTVYFLLKGHGIITMAIIGFFCSQLSNIIFYCIAKHLFVKLEINKKYFKKKELKKLFSFSIWSFIIQIGDQLRLRIDSIVIGLFLSASHVTHYFIGARLVELLMNLIYRVTNITTPIFTKYHALGNYSEIREKLIFLTKINTIMAGFGGGLIILVGARFIERWMGNKYLDAYPILIILTIGIIFEIINNPGNNVLYAISKHKYLAVISTAEGITNCCLSIILIHYFGIIGVALGTTLPMLISKIFIIPFYVCRCIELSPKKYFTTIFSILFITALYLILFYKLVKGTLLVAEYFNIISCFIIAIPVYFIIILLIFFNSREKELLTSFVPSRLKLMKNWF
jgi:O-antigen/teichoic acid export membrane protein